MNTKNENQKIGFESLNEDIKQVLLGTILGDAHLARPSKNASYSCVHSPKQKDYLYWVANVLSRNFKVRISFYYIEKYSQKTYRVSTPCSPILTYLHDLFYVKSRKLGRRWEKIVNLEILNRLGPLALAVWYCDDGTYTIRDKSCALMTQGFTYDENLILKDYFLKIWKIKCVVQKDYRKSHNKSYYKLVFPTKEAFKFLILIKDLVPDSMVYKLGHISEKNKELMKREDERYKSIAKKWYYDNHERSLQRAARYRNVHRDLINTKRVDYYWNNLEKSRESGRKTMIKRRKLHREKVNLINHNYYQRNKDRINKEKRKRIREDSEYREKKNEKQREWYYKNKSTVREKQKLYNQRNKDKIRKQQKLYYKGKINKVKK